MSDDSICHSKIVFFLSSCGHLHWLWKNNIPHPKAGITAGPWASVKAMAANYASNQPLFYYRILTFCLFFKAIFIEECSWWSSTNDQFHYITTLKYAFLNTFCVMRGMFSVTSVVMRKSTFAIELWAKSSVFVMQYHLNIEEWLTGKHGDLDLGIWHTFSQKPGSHFKEKLRI